MIGPYKCCSVVRGDCLELIALIPKRVAIVSDPPYGIGYKASQPGNLEYGLISGDDVPFDPAPFMDFENVIMWGGNNFADRLPIGGWIVWDKRVSEAADRMMGSPFELAWCSKRNLFKMIRLQHGGAKNADAVNGDVANEARYHPTQKPVRLMTECLRYIPDMIDVIDPYCGSGSTLIAAKKLGRHFLGFEIRAEYCQIARDRIARIEAQPSLFEPKPEQLKL
jgi:site-specific DNA-methyltransferase (adenine-specific)